MRGVPYTDDMACSEVSGDRGEARGQLLDPSDHVVVGAGAKIIGSVTIGRHARIGAGSVVTRDVPEGVLAAGNPCRVVREIADRP